MEIIGNCWKLSSGSERMWLQLIYCTVCIHVSQFQVTLGAREYWSLKQRNQQESKEINLISELGKYSRLPLKSYLLVNAPQYDLLESMSLYNRSKNSFKKSIKITE